MLVQRSLVFATSLLSMLAAAGCGQSTDDSATQDIVTDMGRSDGQSDYYYVDGDKLYRGTCTAGLPAFKENCQTDLKSTDYAAFKTAIGKKINDDIASLGAKINTYKTEEATAKQEAAKVDAKLVELAPKLKEKSEAHAAKAALVAEKTKLHASYQAQIDAVNEKLAADATNAQLAALKTQLVAEQTVVLQ